MRESVARTLLMVISFYISRTYGEIDCITLPFGDPAGDRIGPYRNDVISPAITLSTMFSFYGRDENTVYISENGVISFRSPVTDPFPRPLPFSTDTTTSTPAFIAAYWADINTAKNGGAIFYREMNASDRNFCTQKTKVVQFIREGFGGSASGFDPTHLFVVTWDAVHGFRTGKNAVTFQVVLATDSERSYILLLYPDVRWDVSKEHRALVGFNAGDGERAFTHPLSKQSLLLDLDRETNSRRLGVFVYRVDQREIVEPTAGQREEDVCDLSCDDSVTTCKCPALMVLDENGVNCVYPPVAVQLVNNSFAVMEDGVSAMLETNRPDAEMQCQLLRIDRQKNNCSSGVYHRTGLPPDSYTLRVVASVPNTNERAVLRKSFRIFPKGVCSVTILGRGVVVNGTRATVEFVGSDSVVKFQCRRDNHQPAPCSSPYVMENVPSGSHRIIITPKGCGRNRNSASLRFHVN